jgi:hypothetical protein
MENHETGWGRKFNEPITLPDGRRPVVLRDAADYFTNLPQKEAAHPQWQVAIEALMLGVELKGPPMFARIGIVRA